MTRHACAWRIANASRDGEGWLSWRASVYPDGVDHALDVGSVFGEVVSTGTRVHDEVELALRDGGHDQALHLQARVAQQIRHVEGEAVHVPELARPEVRARDLLGSLETQAVHRELHDFTRRHASLECRRLAV